MNQSPNKPHWSVLLFILFLVGTAFFLGLALGGY